MTSPVSNTPSTLSVEQERDAFADALLGYAEVFYSHRDGELTDAEALEAYNAHTRFLGTQEAQDKWAKKGDFWERRRDF